MSQFIEMFGDPMVNDKQWSEYSCISEITQIVLGSTPNSKEPSYWDGDIRWITPAEMTDQSYYIFDTVRHITDEGRKAANLTVLPEGTVLFSTRAPIGKVAIVGKEMCCNQGFKNFICSEKLNNVFLYYTLKLKKDYLCSLGTGTTFKELSKRTVESLKIAVPPIELQNQFETIYKQADKSGFDGRKSQFIEMFGCLAERVALSSLCDTFIDGDWIEAKDQSGSGIRLIQTGNVGVGTFKDKGDRARYISEETFNRLNCTEVVEGDILISRLPEPVGRACIIPAGLGKSITAVDCTIIRLNDKVLPKFFVTFTNTPDYAMQIKKVLSGTTRLRVSRANLGKIQVPLPAIDKQQQFVTIAEQADKSGSVLLKLSSPLTK